jgi:hypothetical protein
MITSRSVNMRLFFKDSWSSLRPGRIHRQALLLLVGGWLLCCSGLALAEEVDPALSQSQAERLSSPEADPLYRFLFENERFVVSLQEVVLTAEGKGRYRYQRKEMEEMVLTFVASPAVMEEIRSLFEELDFLRSSESYQHRRDFSHLGTITLAMRRNGAEREVRFNYADRPQINQLVRLFRGLATQESRLFEIETVRATDPISTPAQLRLLEGELKSRTIADPKRFVPLLREIRLDEGIPLIARNHAARLLEQIDRPQK